MKTFIKNLVEKLVTVYKINPYRSIVFLLVFVSLLYLWYNVTQMDIETIRTNLNAERVKIIQEAETEKEIVVKNMEEAKNQFLILKGENERLTNCIDFNTLQMDEISEPKKCDNFQANEVGGGEEDWSIFPPVSVEQEIYDEQPTKKTPDELFYTTKTSDNCWVSQKEEDHYILKNGGVLATDVACGFKAEIYAPDYLNEDIIYNVLVFREGDDDYKLVGNPLGNYVELHWTDSDKIERKWVLAHLKTRLNDFDGVETGDRIGEMDLSGYTTGYHSHIELWQKINGEWQNASYTTRSKALENKRTGTFENDGKGAKIYFTMYDLGDPSQNDDSPCHGASGKDLCKLAETGVQTIALTVDQRELYGVKFGDQITLVGEDGKGYKVQVEDEMNWRFRNTCIRSTSGFCKKGDIARYKGESALPSGVYSIKL